MTILFRNALLLALCLVLVNGTSAEDPKTDPSKPAKAAFRNLDFDKAVKAAKTEKKVVFIDFYATWCGPCKALDATTFKDDKVQSFLKSKTVAVKVDVDKNKELAKKFSIRAIPTLVFVSDEGKEIGRVVGYKDVAGFLKEAEKHTSK